MTPPLASLLPLVLLPLVFADSSNVLQNFTLSYLSSAESQCGHNADPLTNKNHETPCTVALDLVRPCQMNNTNQPLKTTGCTCNLVFYNLLSACSVLCVPVDGLITYTQWTDGCDGMNIAVTMDYPYTNSKGAVDGLGTVDIPQWAHDPITDNTGTFDVQAVLSRSAGNSDWTLIQKLTPVITVISFVIVVLVIWYLYTRYRRRRGRKAQDGISLPRLGGHKHSDSQTPFNSTSDLRSSKGSHLDHPRSFFGRIFNTSTFSRSRTRQHSGSRIPFDPSRNLARSNSGISFFDRSWNFFGGIFNGVTTVRRERRNTNWAIDDSESIHGEVYHHDDSRTTYYDPYASPPQLEPNRRNRGPPLQDSSDLESPPNNFPSQHGSSESQWWNFEWLKGFRFMGRSRLNMETSKTQSSLPRTGGRDDQLGLLPGNEAGNPRSLRSGVNTDRLANLSPSRTGLRTGGRTWSNVPDGPEEGDVIVISREYRASACLDEPESHSRTYANDADDMSITRVPNENISRDDDFLEHGTRDAARFNDRRDSQMQPPLMPTQRMLANSLGVRSSIQNKNDLHEHEHAQMQSVSSLPHLAHISDFGTLERHTGSSNVPSGSDMNGIGLLARPSNEQLGRSAHALSDSPALLFPAAVRATGYPASHMNDTLANRNATNHNRSASHVGAVVRDERVNNGHDRMASREAVTPTHLRGLSASASVASSSLPDLAPLDLPPYQYSQLRTDARNASEEPAPPYPTSQLRHQNRPDPYIHGSSKARRLPNPSAPRPPTIEAASPTELDSSSHGAFTTAYTIDTGTDTRYMHTPLASSEFLPLSDLTGHG